MKLQPTFATLLFLTVTWSVTASPLKGDQPSFISDVRVYQTLTQKGNYYPASTDVHVSFNLAQASDVTVEVGAQVGAGGQLSGARDFYMADPLHVQTLSLGHLEAGPHDAVWNGLDEKGQPVTNTVFNGWYSLLHGIWVYQKGVLPTPDQIFVHPVVNLFRFTVHAGTNEVGINYGRVPDGVGAYHAISIGDCREVTQDEDGNLVVCNNSAQYSSHLSPGGEELAHYPEMNEGVPPGACPESNYGLADRHGHALIGDVLGLFRFDLKSGREIGWTQSDYAHDGILGRKPNPQETEAMVKAAPGVAYGYNNWTVDLAGNIYLLRMIVDLSKHPNWADNSTVLADVQVFDNNGVYKKTIPLPKEVWSGIPSHLAADKNGDVWVGNQTDYLIDNQTGAIKAKFKNPTRKVFVGADGSVYGWSLDGVNLYRLHADGTPFPFGATAMGVKNNGESLSWGGDDSPLPPSLRSREPASIIGEAAGDFYVVIGPGAGDQPILHFTADGKFLPAAVPRFDLVQSRSGNAFIENEPAAFDVCVNNPSAKDLFLTLDWTLTDFSGTKTTGKSQVTVKALTRQASVLTIPVPEFGFYHWEGALENDDNTFKSALARVRYHDPKIAPDSHFAICGNLNFGLGTVVGQKKDRGSSYEWEWREPAQGLLIPDVPQIGWTAHRNIAAKAGVLLGEDSSYAEPWTEGYDNNQIHDLSLYLNDWLRVVDKINGNNIQQYQFWNEPNNYWSRRFPFWAEYYNTVNADFWRINKSRDKEIRSIPDGNAGNFDIPTSMGADGTNIYCDAVPSHYLTPGLDQQPKVPESLGKSEMGLQGFPESTAINVKKLIAVRDQFYPGKPVLTTEEGWYGSIGLNEKSAADSIPRMYIPCIAAGLEELYWFYWGGQVPGPPGGYTTPVTSQHPPECIPQPAFSSYATMTQELEGAEYVGMVNLQKEGTQAYLFRKGDKMILPVWALVGQIDVTVPIGEDEVKVFDLMSHQSQVRAVSGAIPLRLNDSVQYVEFPFNAWAKTIAKQELDRQLTDLKVDDVKSISDEMKKAASTALTDLGAMNRYYHLVKAARQACFTGEWSESAPDGNTVKSLRAGILTREGEDGYLRQTRLPLLWTEQLVRVAAIQGGDLEKRLLSVANDAALASQSILNSEPIMDPGCTVNAFIGDVGEIEKIRGVTFKWGDAAWPFYEAQFRSQIPKKAGDSFELELTMWNFYRHPIQATVAPKLPDGWTAVATKPADTSALAPGKFTRLLYTITIPADAKAGLYPIDAITTYNGKTDSSVHPQRVQIQ